MMVYSEILNTSVYAEETNQQSHQVNQPNISENELDSFEKDIKDTSEQIDSLEKKKETLQKDVTNLYNEISDLNVRIQKRASQIRNQARDVQVSGLGANYLEILVNSESIPKALSRFQGIRTIIEANNLLLEKQTLDRDEVEKKTDEVEAQVATLETAMRDLDAQKAALNILKIQQEIAQNDLKFQQATQENEKEVLFTQKELSEKKLKEEQEKITKEKEENRQKEAEEAVRLAEAQASNPGLLSMNVVGLDGLTTKADLVISQSTTNGGSNTTSIGGMDKVSQAKQKAAKRALNSVGQTNPTGWGKSGECIVAVQNWLNASGIRFIAGGPHSGYVNSGAKQVAWSDVQVGDVVQYENSFSPDAWLDGVHTVLVVGVDDGKVQIVESNNPAGSGYVSTTTGWTPKPYVTNFRAVVWRFPN